MRILTTPIDGILVIEPEVFTDHRGFFFESFNQRIFEIETGISCQFVQDNHSKSSKNVLRGLHYQINQAQSKLVRVIEGEVWDVAVDIRTNSPTYSQWYGTKLSAENKKQLWIGPGLAHGFLVTSLSAQVLYKASDYYAPEYERSLLWNDPQLAIDWPLQDQMPILSTKDAKGHTLTP